VHIARWILSAAAAASVAGLVSAIPASAGWSARATATGSVTVGQETVSVTPTAVSTVMTNDLYQTTYLVSVTNTQASTTFAGASNVTLTALPASTPATGLGTALTAVVWRVVTTGACTTAANPVPGAVSGPWSDGVTSAAVTLAPQATALFCVRSHPTGGTSSSANSGQNRQTVAAALGSPLGTTSFAPAFRADITVGNVHGQATSAADPITTSQIYPFTVLSDLTTYYQVEPQNILSPAALCLDLRGGVDVPVTAVIDTATCHDIGTDVSLGNQAISMLPVAGMNAVQLRVRTTTSIRGFVGTNGSAAGSALNNSFSNTSSLQQLWIPQLVSDDGGPLLQLVNSASGLCATAPAAAGAVTTQACTGTAATQTYWSPVGLPFP
jgi:hypothetical protein